MWRLARNILPTRSKLLSENVQVGNGCYLCDEKSQEIWHLINNCQYNIAVMNFSDFQVKGVANIQDIATQLEFLQTLFGSLEAHDRDLLAPIWEGVWMQRNQAWLDKPVVAPFQLFLQVTTNLRSFRRAEANNGDIQPIDHTYNS